MKSFFGSVRKGRIKKPTYTARGRTLIDVITSITSTIEPAAWLPASRQPEAVRSGPQTTVTAIH